jgi:hypothetical protein
MKTSRKADVDTCNAEIGKILAQSTRTVDTGDEASLTTVHVTLVVGSTCTRVHRSLALPRPSTAHASTPLRSRQHLSQLQRLLLPPRMMMAGYRLRELHSLWWP